MIKYYEPTSLSRDVQDWISDINGKIKYARAHPNTDQYGVNPEFWQRVIAPDIQTISDLKGNQVSHKMSWGEKDGKIYTLYQWLHNEFDTEPEPINVIEAEDL